MLAPFRGREDGASLRWLGISLDGAPDQKTRIDKSLNGWPPPQDIDRYQLRTSAKCCPDSRLRLHRTPVVLKRRLVIPGHVLPARTNRQGERTSGAHLIRECDEQVAPYDRGGRLSNLDAGTAGRRAQEKGYISGFSSGSA